jgi:hypothetical protein
MPELAPVTRAVLPVHSKITLLRAEDNGTQTTYAVRDGTSSGSKGANAGGLRGRTSWFGSSDTMR